MALLVFVISSHIPLLQKWHQISFFVHCAVDFSRINHSIVSVSFVFNLPISTAGHGTISFCNFVIYPLLQSRHQISFWFTVCSQFFKNHWFDSLENFTDLFSDLDSGPVLCIIACFYLYIKIHLSHPWISQRKLVQMTSHKLYRFVYHSLW
jgi:hypothetical protein